MSKARWLTRQRMHTDERSARRVLWVGRGMLGLVTVVLLVLLGRVVQLEAAPPPRIGALTGTQSSDMHIDGRRGQLLGRRGRILASTHIAHLLFVDPTLITDHNTFA